MVMKKIFKNSAIIALLCIATNIGFTACSDWTDTESIDINSPNTGNMDANTYAKYLKSIREYKKQDHKLVYTWYDNSVKVPVNRSNHLTSLPDSIDIVVLMHPDSLVNRELEEISTIKNDKSMQVIFSIDYNQFEQEYRNTLEIGGVFNDSVFITHLKGRVQDYLSLADKYNYDGIIIKYGGKATQHLTTAELEAYKTLQNTFISPIKEWYNNNSSKIIAFEGKPENLLDKTILTSCKNIVIDGVNSTSLENIIYDLEMSSVNGVPTDRFITKVSATSFSDSDKETGYFVNGSIAVSETALWISKPETKYTKSGIGIYNVQNDFFNPSRTYPNTRNAIKLLNPSFN